MTHQPHHDPMTAAEALVAAGEWTQAAASYRNLAHSSAHAGEARFRLGQMARAQGRPGEAIHWLQQALAVRARWPEANFELALAYLESQRTAEAIHSLLAVLAANSAHVGARRTIADLLLSAGRWREAVHHYAALLPLQPEEPGLFQRFGLCCQELGELALAEKAYLKTLQLGHDAPELQFNLGLVRLKQNRAAEAIASLQHAVQLDPKLTMAHLAIANAYRKLGDAAAAEMNLRQELCINPNCADAAINLGVVLQERHRVGEAIDCYKQAIQLNPHHPILHWNFAIASLLAGDYETGWTEYEWRWQVKHKPKPKLDQPEWDGGDLGKRTILLYAEQGFGDTLMFIRYAPLAARRNGRVLLQCQTPLKRLLSAVPEFDRVLAEGEPLPEFDLQAPLMSLPRIFGSALDAEHSWEPYLRAPTKPDWRLPIDNPKAMKIGLAWASNPRHPIFSNKSVDLPRWEPILNLPGCEFFSLQVDPNATALEFMRQHSQLHDLHERLGDFADTAAAIHQMDLVICVDTAVAHLAGALGHPVWVMLPFAADWRWLLKRKDSPWYPTMSLFRQHKPGDWDSVIGDVAWHLEQLVARYSSQPPE